MFNNRETRKCREIVQCAIILILLVFICVNLKEKEDSPDCPNTEPKKFKYENFECYQFPKNVTTPIKLLEDVTDSARKPRKGKTMFFIETSCSKNGLINLNSRQIFAIESAAVTNPHRDIFVLFASPVGYLENNETPFVKILKSFHNVFLRIVNIPKYVVDTPVEKWLSTGELFTSKHLQVHVSDFLRLVTLYKFGGTYLDLDFIVLKNFDKLKPNFFGEELYGRTGNSIIDFDHEGIGHEMATILLQEFAWKWNGQEWSNNGPFLMERVAERVCKTYDHAEFTRDQCIGFEVHPMNTFYPVEGLTEWWMLYYENSTEYLMEKFKNSNSFAIHTWNTMNVFKKQRVNEPNSTFSILARKLAPKLYAAVNYTHLLPPV